LTDTAGCDTACPAVIRTSRHAHLPGPSDLHYEFWCLSTMMTAVAKCCQCQGHLVWGLRHVTAGGCGCGAGATCKFHLAQTSSPPLSFVRPTATALSSAAAAVRTSATGMVPGMLRGRRLGSEACVRGDQHAGCGRDTDAAALARLPACPLGNLSCTLGALGPCHHIHDIAHGSDLGVNVLFLDSAQGRRGRLGGGRLQHRARGGGWRAG
jgi:hypothetical protein